MPQNTLSDEELRSISWAVFNRYGLDFTEYEPVSLKRRILRIIHRYELESVYGLWKKVLYDPEFMTYFRDEVSVGMTEMFRNPDFWAYLRDHLFPKAPRKNSLRTWHAGCSTGEEVFTTAIVLDELDLLKGAKALATDLSQNFLGQAQAATYDFSQLRKYEKSYRQYHPGGSIYPYFQMEEEQETATLLPRLRRYAEFHPHNLTEEPPGKKFDIIFCRNVMIYFNEKLKMDVLKRFHRALETDGLLVIGFFDGMPPGYETYFKYFDSGMKVFQKI